MIDVPAILNARPWRAISGFARGFSFFPPWPGLVWTHRLRTHLMSVLLLALVPFMLATLSIAFLADTAIDQSRRARIDNIAATLADAVDHEFELAQTVLTALAASPAGDETDVAGMVSWARMASELLGARIVLRRPPLSADAPPDLLARPILAASAAVLSSGRPRVTDVMPAPQSLLPVTAVVVPVLRHGVAVATMEAILPSDRLIAALRRYHYQPGGFAVLVDTSGRIAASTRDVARLVGQLYVPSDFDLPVSRNLVRAPGWRVFYGDHRNAPDELQADLGALGIAAIVLSTCFAVALMALVAARLRRSLRALTDLVGDVATGSKRAEATMAPSGIVEFEELRQGMIRADAVLRRRAAAERIALREARTGHELLISVVNGTAEWIHVKDLELRYVLVNRAGLATGPEPFAEWQVLGRAASDLFPPEIARRIDAADRQVLATGRTTGFEQDYVHAGSGNTLWVSMTVAPWKDATGRVVGIVSVSRDITEQRSADTRLHAIQADLLRATRLSTMGAMASGLAHELNQPLAAATNYLNAGGRLLDRAAQGDGQVFPLARSAVSDAAQQLLRAGAIVRRLRDFVERGEVELQMEGAADLLREACDLAGSDGIAEGITLRHDIEPAVGMILVDRTQIQQVLLNLIRNAAEAILSVDADTQTGWGREGGEVVVCGHRDQDGNMLIDVRDNGPGLSPGIAERLFEPFVSSKQSGMGIGLAICRTIIEGHGGSLTAQPNALRGMRFRITLPALISSGELS
jgi:PAS domain S-box-containing protein